MVLMQVHTFDHTLSEAVQDTVASTPGVSFHPWGVGDPGKGEGMRAEHPHLGPSHECARVNLIVQ